MEKTSKDLLELEHKYPSSFNESLLVFGNNRSSLQHKPLNPPSIAPLPSSLMLGKVKDFLGVISEANKDLELKAKDKPEDYDIEALNGNESEFIEMDLMLGVADLHTPEALAAAEAAIAGNQAIVDLYKNDDSSDSEISSDDEDDSDNDEITRNEGPVKQDSESNKRKRAKIVVLP